MPSTAGGGDGLRVETDTLISASDQLHSIAEELGEGLQQLVSCANEVVDGSWRGEAATAFSREWDEFRDAAQAIVEDADVIADLVALSVKHYMDTDADGAAMLRSTWLGT